MINIRTFSGPMSNFRTLQGLIFQSPKIWSFQYQWEPCLKSTSVTRQGPQQIRTCTHRMQLHTQQQHYNDTCSQTNKISHSKTICQFDMHINSAAIQQMLLKTHRSIPACGFLLVLYSNTSPKKHHFCTRVVTENDGRIAVLLNALLL